MKLFNK